MARDDCRSAPRRRGRALATEISQGAVFPAPDAFCTFGAVGGKFGATALALGAVIAVLVAGSTAAYGGSRGVRTPSTPIYRVATHERLVALTFDDGPDPRWTPTVLDLLARYQAHATFFDVGRRAVGNPDLVARELAAGHEVGDHTWSHPHLPRLSSPSAATEIAAGKTALSSLTAQEMRLFRPPYGQTTSAINAVAAKQGMRTVLWDACLEHFVRHNHMRARHLSPFGKSHC